MDYSEILTTVEARMNRSDLGDLIPAWITRVEEEINTRLARDPVRPMVNTYTLEATTQRVDLPDDFIDAIDLTASDGTDEWPLARIEPGRRMARYKYATAPGVEYDEDVPQHYQIIGDTIVLSMTPESALDLTLDCYTKLTPLTSTNSSNWLVAAHGDVYEFGVLAHAAKHIRDMDYYRENRDLFISALEMVTQAYPERKRDIGLRITDAPWFTNRWSIIDG